MPVRLSFTRASRKTTRVRILIVSATSWASTAGAASNASNPAIIKRDFMWANSFFIIDISSGYARLRRAVHSRQARRSREYPGLGIANGRFVSQGPTHFFRVLQQLCQYLRRESRLNHGCFSSLNCNYEHMKILTSLPHVDVGLFFGLWSQSLNQG